MLVELDDKSAMEGLLHVPDDWQKQPQTGTVIAAGPGGRVRVNLKSPLEKKLYGKKPTRWVDQEWKPGDRVMFGKWNGWLVPDKYTPEGKERWMMTADTDIYLAIESE